MKYAPARNGLKPYLAEISDFGSKRERIVWAANPGDAKFQAKGRMRYVYAQVRRATPDDLERVLGSES